MRKHPKINKTSIFIEENHICNNNLAKESNILYHKDLLRSKVLKLHLFLCIFSIYIEPKQLKFRNITYLHK